MPKRNWDGRSAPVVTALVLIIAVLVMLLVWDGASSYTENRVNAERNANGYAAQTEAEIQAQCAVPLTPECVAQIVATSREQQRAEYDLAAQRDMAKWAMAMLIVSAIGTIVGLVGIVFVYRTLHAARKGNKIARKSAERQLRAYVTLTIDDAPPIEAGVTPSFKYSFRNSGQTPAYDLRFGIEFGMARNLIPESQIESPIAMGPTKMTLDPGAGVAGEYFGGRALTEEDAAHIRHGNVGQMFVRGAITYRDTFDRDRVTRFLYIYRGDLAMRVGKMTPYHLGNDAT